MNNKQSIFIGQQVNEHDETARAKRVVTGFSIPPYDYISVAYPDSVTETYIYKSGGSGGTTVATITVVYTSSTKDSLSSVTKS